MLFSFLLPLAFQAQALEPASTDNTSAGADSETTTQDSRVGSNVPEGTVVIDGEKIRCRYERSVNSRIPKKVCHTLAEWEERRKQQEEEMRSHRNRSGGCGSEGPC